MIYLYNLLSPDGKIMYAGLTVNISQRRGDHRRTRPPHQFVVIQTFANIKEAAAAEVECIQLNNLIADGWNISPGGDYEGNSGYSRKGIGGVRKGNVPWNYKKTNVFSEDTRKRWSEVRKGRVHSSKLSEDQWTEIKLLYRSHPHIDGVGVKSKNGKILPYKRAFANHYCTMYGVTSANIYRIIKNED
jgi:hypothetical protein